MHISISKKNFTTGHRHEGWDSSFSRTLYKLFHGCRVARKLEDVETVTPFVHLRREHEKRHRLLSRKGKSSWLKRCRRYLFALPRDLVLTLLSREGYSVSIAVCLPPSGKEKENVGRNKGVGKHKRRSCSLPRDFARGISFKIYFFCFVLIQTYAFHMILFIVNISIILFARFGITECIFYYL